MTLSLRMIFAEYTGVVEKGPYSVAHIGLKLIVVL